MKPIDYIWQGYARGHYGYVFIEIQQDEEPEWTNIFEDGDVRDDLYNRDDFASEYRIFYNSLDDINVITPLTLEEVWPGGK